MSEIVQPFQKLVEYFNSLKLARHMRMLFYSVLKTEGDIFVELGQFDFAIKCYKTIKDYCDDWTGMEYVKMKTYE